MAGLLCSRSLGLLLLVIAGLSWNPCNNRQPTLAEAKTVVLGKANKYWHYSISSWTPPTLAAGDIIVFKWRNALHDVVKVVDQTAFDGCSYARATRITQKKRNYLPGKGVRVGATTAYYTSTVAHDCHMGLKIAITPA